MSLRTNPAVQSATATQATKATSPTKATQATSPTQAPTAAQDTRPTVPTPSGPVYTNTPAYALYAELLRVHGTLASLLHDMETMAVTGPQAVQRINDFLDSLSPAHASLRTGYLLRITQSLQGNTAVPLGAQLQAMRHDISSHWHYVVGCALQLCDRPTHASTLAPAQQPYRFSGYDKQPNHDAIMAARAAVEARR